MVSKIRLWAGAVFFLLNSVVGVVAAGPDASTGRGDEMISSQSLTSYDRGIVIAQNGDYSNALNLFEQALLESPNNPDIMLMIAQTQWKLGKVDDAIQSYRLAIKLRPKFPEARKKLGEIYIVAALEEIKTLRSYGEEGADQLAGLTTSFKKGAESLK